jgi:release factor glutamine methyltransferase
VCGDPVYHAVDLSEGALELARENARENRVESVIEFRLGNLLGGFGKGSLNAVVANLPYIPSAECGGLPRHIREHEPLSALDGGADGLDLIRQVIQQAAEVLCPGGRIFLEIGFDQAIRVVDTLKDCGFVEMVVHRDLGGRDRVVQAIR